MIHPNPHEYSGAYGVVQRGNGATPVTRSRNVSETLGCLNELVRECVERARHDDDGGQQVTDTAKPVELVPVADEKMAEPPMFPTMLSDSTGFTPSSPPAPRQGGIPRLTIVGPVEHGNAWGRLLGFPTANMPLEDDTVDGVWAGTVSFMQGGIEVEYVAAISVGTRPTYYSDGVRLLEAHLLNFAGDLYDTEITVALHKLVRLQEKYDSSEELIAQLVIDVQDTRTWAAENVAGITTAE
jgi:riboflavin kinase/FMN adenylyltransferase